MVIDGAEANGNGENTGGEAGIWFDETARATAKNCDVKDNPWGFIVSQSDTVKIEGCEIAYAQFKQGNPFRGGVFIGTGQPYHLFGGSPPPRYIGMLAGGVRGLTIENCDFHDNGTGGTNGHDIVYKDDKINYKAPLFQIDQDFMAYTNNKLKYTTGPLPIIMVTTTNPLQEVRFDLAGGAKGYVQGSLENLQINP